MPLMDEFQKERELIKNADFKTKVKYFWDYYKWHSLIVVIAIVFVITLIYNIMTRKEDALFAAMLNCTVLDDYQAFVFEEDYKKYIDLDTKKYDIQIETTLDFNQSAVHEVNMSASQRLFVYISTGELDVILGGSDIFPQQANQGIFCDLREILSAEQLEKYEPYFYYVDQTIVDEWYEISSTYDLEAEYPDMPEPTKPEEMDNPIPVGLFVTDSTRFDNLYYFGEGYCAIGVMVNAPHPENSVKFIDYLFE